MAKKAVKTAKATKKPVAQAKPAKASKPAAKLTKSVKPAKAAPKPAVVKKAPPAPKKVEKAVVKLDAKVADSAKAKEKPKLKLAPVVAESLPAAESTVKSSSLKTPAKKVAAKAEGVKSEAAPKSVKATLKLLKNEKGDDTAHWQELHDKFRSEKPQAYDMRAVFEAGKPLQHKLLGWGWIIWNENDRLDVLFKDGRRTLISNYNPNR